LYLLFFAFFIYESSPLAYAHPRPRYPRAFDFSGILHIPIFYYDVLRNIHKIYDMNNYDQFSKKTK